MHRQQGDEIRQFGIHPARVGEQPRQPARRLVLQVEQLHGPGQLLLAEAAVVGRGDQVRLGHLGTQVLPLERRRQQYVDEIPHAYGRGCAQSGPAREKRVGHPDRLLDRQRQHGRQELPVQIEPDPARRRREGLPVLFGAEQRARFEEPRLQLGVAADAVLDDVDELGGPPLVLMVLGLVAGLADVRQDRVLVPVPVRDMVECLGDHVGHGFQPVDRAHIATRRVQRAPQRLRVLHRAIARLLGGELRVGEPAPADQNLQLHLGRDLGAGDVGVEGAHQDVDGFVRRTEIDTAAVSRDLFEQLEVIVAAHIAAVGREGAVHGAEAAVDAADVDQVLQDPARHPLMLGERPLRGLGGNARNQPGHDLLVVGARVEVHVERDEVDRRERDLGHRIDRVLTGEIGLAHIEVVQRSRARERAQAPRQALVGGRARCRGRMDLRRGRSSHDVEVRRSH